MWTYVRAFVTFWVWLRIAKSDKVVDKLLIFLDDHFDFFVIWSYLSWDNFLGGGIRYRFANYNVLDFLRGSMLTVIFVGDGKGLPFIFGL